MSDPTSTPPSPAPQGRTGTLLPGFAGLALGTVALLALAHHLAYFVDDAFITFRYARNWSEWGVPVFNSFELNEGFERVEGYSNFLWMALLSLLYRLGLDLETVTPIVQGVAGILTLACVARACAKPLALGPVATLAAPVLLATAAPFVAWTSGGMETGLLTLILTLFFLSCLDVRGDRRGLRMGLLGGLLALVRVEGMAWVIGLLGACVVAEFLSGGGLGRLSEQRRRWLVGFGVAALVFVGQLAYRKVVYGQWISNTVTAKTGGEGAEVYARGGRQIASWALVTLTPIAALLALPFALRHRSERARTTAVATLLSVLGFVLYNLVTGGDWMPYFRFLAPAAPLLAILLAIALDRLPKGAAWTAALALAATQPLTLFDIHLAPLQVREGLRFRSFTGGYRTEAQRVTQAQLNTAHFHVLGAALNTGTTQGDVLAFGAIGSPGWYAPDLDFLDRNGLVTPVVSRREVVRGKGTAGHEKRVPHAFFLDQGEPQAKWLFARMLLGTVRGPQDRHFLDAMRAVRSSGVVAHKRENGLFERTVMRTIPISEGPAAGQTLILLERAEPTVGRAFWAQIR